MLVRILLLVYSTTVRLHIGGMFATLIEISLDSLPVDDDLLPAYYRQRIFVRRSSD
jgi:hypothetical protein